MEASDLLSKTKDSTLTYRAIQVLFRIVLRIFYNRIVLENAEYLPKDGTPTILCANHSNSLTDPTLLISQISSKQRKMLRLTAKDSHFRRGNIASWLIENAGTIPIMRAKDHPGMANADIQTQNKKTFAKLIAALEKGDCVCLFPEGISRFHPNPAPLKTGVARIASEVVTAHQHDPAYKLTIVNLSITYLHRERFRSNVYATFNPPIILTPSTRPDLIHSSISEVQQEKAIRDLTTEIQTSLVSGCLSAPTWKILKVAHTARRLYAPAGPEEFTLGQFIRLTQAFVTVFSSEPSEETQKLMSDLMRWTEYQKDISSIGLKDHRLFVHSQLSSWTLLKRFALRLVWSFVLCTLASPGLVLWLPTFAYTKYSERKFRKKGPRWDVYDEIAQTKLIYGLVCCVLTWLVINIVFFPFILITSWAVPLVGWLSLRWYEDLVSDVRSMVSLLTLLRLNFRNGGKDLVQLQERREALRVATLRLAANHGLPYDYREWLLLPSNQVNLPKKKPALRRRLSYFSLNRRRLKDWSEAVRLWDLENEDDSGSEEDVQERKAQ